jgi:hypothetical protein
MADRSANYSLTTFNSSGELVQIKHALAAVQSGATSLGIRAVNGVVLATEKKLPSTLVGEAECWEREGRVGEGERREEGDLSFCRLLVLHHPLTTPLTSPPTPITPRPLSTPSAVPYNTTTPLTPPVNVS